MAEIKVEVEGQLLTIQNQEIIASGNVNYDTCSFTFDREWEGFVKTAVFYQDKAKVQYAVLGSDGTCAVPAAAMAKEGNMYIGVFGVSGPKVITSTVERIYIRQGAISGDTFSADPGDDIFLAIIVQYQQVMEQIKAYDIKMEEFMEIMKSLNAFDVVEVMERLTAAEGKLEGMGEVIEDAVEKGICTVSGGLRFAQSVDGAWGYIVPGSEVVIPFGQGGTAPGWDGELEDASWVQAPSGTNSNFVKAISKSGYPVAVTADGTVVYSSNGKTWEKSKAAYQNCKFTDIDWDGERFLITGSYTNEASRTVGLILATEDFREYRKLEIPNSRDSETEYDTCYYAVYPVNGKYVVLAARISGPEQLIAYVGNLADNWTVTRTVNGSGLSTTKVHSVNVAKNSTGMLVCFKHNTTISANAVVSVVKVSGEVEYQNIFHENATNSVSSVFECKDALYLFSRSSEMIYKLEKINESGETAVVNTGQNFGFLRGLYFNKCEVFINRNSMLVVKSGENLADKTVNDLLDVSPEAAMSCIIKAFGLIYIFGSQGLILVSA